MALFLIFLCDVCVLIPMICHEHCSRVQQPDKHLCYCCRSSFSPLLSSLVLPLLLVFSLSTPLSLSLLRSQRGCVRLFRSDGGVGQALPLSQLSDNVITSRLVTIYGQRFFPALHRAMNIQLGTGTDKKSQTSHVDPTKKNLHDSQLKNGCRLRRVFVGGCECVLVWAWWCLV